MGGSNHLRSLQVPITITLGRLYRVIQAAMGWTDNPLREFIIGDERLGIPYSDDDFLPYPLCPETCVKLDVALMGRRHFDDLHDFGDD